MVDIDATVFHDVRDVVEIQLNRQTVKQDVRWAEAGVPVVLIRAEVIRECFGSVQQASCGGPVLMASGCDGGP